MSHRGHRDRRVKKPKLGVLCDLYGSTFLHVAIGGTPASPREPLFLGLSMPAMQAIRPLAWSLFPKTEYPGERAMACQRPIQRASDIARGRAAATRVVIA